LVFGASQLNMQHYAARADWLARSGVKCLHADVKSLGLHYKNPTKQWFSTKQALSSHRNSTCSHHNTAVK